MPVVHEFGILDEFDRQKDYIEYTPRLYDCIAVDDEIVCSLAEKLSIMKTYFHSFNRPEHGLAYCGITIIPPESLSLFHDAVVSSEYYAHSEDLRELAAKILQAAKAKKHMIHFGI